MQIPAGVTTTVIAAIVGLAVWFIQTRIEQIRQAEARLRDERREVYTAVLEPYIRLFAEVGDERKTKQTIRFATSYDYKKSAFELSLIGSDQVVLAFNDMMHLYYTAEREGRQVGAKEMLDYWGRLLLEIRKSVGDPNTKLHRREMLRGLIKDADELL